MTTHGTPPFVALTAPMDMYPTFGALWVGCTAGNVLYGFNLLLSYQYYDYFRNDSIWMKLLIGWLVLCDTLFTLSANQALWFWTISYWGNVAAINAIPWGWTALPMTVGPLVSSVQAYFAFRVWILSRKENWWLPAIIFACALAGMGFVGANFGESVVLTQASQLSSATTSFIGWMSVATGADGLITGGMLWYLKKTEANFALTQTIMQHWSRLALETNLVTACGSFAAVFLFKYAGGFIFLATYFPTARVYFLSLLVAVNSRIRLSEEARAMRGQTGSGSKGGFNGSGSGQTVSIPRFNPAASTRSMGGPHHPAQEVHVLTQVHTTRGEKDLLGYPTAASPKPYPQVPREYATQPRQDAYGYDPRAAAFSAGSDGSNGSSMRGPNAI